MRALGKNGLNIVVSIPRVVIEREAERRGLTVGEFLDQFKAVAQYNSLDGVLYTSEKTEEGKVPRYPADPSKEGTDGGEQ